MKPLRINYFLFYLICLLAVTACKKESGNKLKRIEVTPESLNLAIGETMRLDAKPVPLETSPDEMPFIWESVNSAIATVSSTGHVVAKSSGSTEIVVSARISKKISTRIPVNVKEQFTLKIGNTTYQADTLDFKEFSKSLKWLKIGVPNYVNGFGTFGKGLIFNIFEADLTDPDLKVEVCPASQATWGNIERPTAMYARKKKEYAKSRYRPIAVINGDFYLLSSGNHTGYAYINNRPLGMEIGNGMVVQTPWSWTNGLVVRDEQKVEYHENVSFSGDVTAGEYNFKITEVNGFAKAGELVLFNNLANSYPTDSAFVWSPYTSTMVSLSHPENGWVVNNQMNFTVTDIEYDVETTIPAKSPYKGKDFNGQGAILVGNSAGGSSANDSKAFLDNLKIGDNVSATMNIKLSGKSVSDKHLSMVGFSEVILKNGVCINTWNEAHPRTAVGYSKDGKKIYLLVIDGRASNYSAGSKTGDVADILKEFGAYNGVNLDGGGSSCMVVDGEIKNKPSDGSERAVANGVMILTK